MYPDETLWTAVFYGVFIIGVFVSLYWATRQN
jgi:hypothetical protein